MDVAGGAGATGTSATATASITPVTDNAWVFGAAGKSQSSAFTSDGGQTEDWNFVMNVNGSATAGGHKGPISPAASTSMTWTLTSAQWAVSLAAIRPAAGAAASVVTPRLFALLGVGA